MGSEADSPQHSVPDHAFSVVAVPAHLTQQIIDYVDALMEKDDDTSGFMIGGISTVSGTGPLAEKMKHTACTWKKTGDFGWDVYCND